MEKKWLFTVGIVIVMILAAMAFFSITQTTGSFVYGKCWPVNEVNNQDLLDLRVKGCMIETGESRVCCPFEECPDISGIICK